MATARCVPPRTPFVGSGRVPEGGQLATHKRDFLAHASGEEWHHCADQINMNPPLVTVGGDNVQEALENLEAAVGGNNTLEEVLRAGNQSNGEWINLTNNSWIASTTGNIDLMVETGFGTRFFHNGIVAATVLASSFQSRAGIAFTWQTAQNVGASGAATFTSGVSTLFNSGQVTVQSGSAAQTSGVVYLRSGDAGASSGNVIVRSGSAPVSGNVSIISGAASAGASGYIEINTGVGTGGNSGYISIFTGAEAFPRASGAISIYTGNGYPSGELTLKTGDSPGSGTSGNISIETGAASITGSISITTASALLTAGDISIIAGDTTAGQAGSLWLIAGSGSAGAADDAGNITIQGGNASGGDVFIYGGNNSLCSSGGGNIVITSGQGGAFDNGEITISTPTGTTGESGDIRITTGNAGGDQAGDILLRTGNSSGVGRAGNISLEAGHSTTNTAAAGIVTISSGNGSTNVAAADINLYTGYRSFDGTSGNLNIRNVARSYGNFRFENIGQNDPLMRIAMFKSGSFRVEIYYGYEEIT